MVSGEDSGRGVNKKNTRAQEMERIITVIVDCGKIVDYGGTIYSTKLPSGGEMDQRRGHKTGKCKMGWLSN